MAKPSGNTKPTLLQERQSIYGRFDQQATTAQELKDVLKAAPRYEELTQPQKESLDLIATKLSRIVHGSAEHRDSWVDIAGYSNLIVHILDGNPV